MIQTLTSVTPDVLKEIEEEMRLRKTSEVFLLFNLGSQFNHLIAQTMARIGVFCLVADPASVTAEDVSRIQPKGIILSGGPGSMVDEPPPFDKAILDLEIPTLGICLGFQLWADHVGAHVRHAGKGEFNTHPLHIISDESGLLKGCSSGDLVLESHGDAIERTYLIHGSASTENSPLAIGEHGHMHGVQFHPEVPETTCGEQIFRNFVFGICGAKDSFPGGSVAEAKISELAKILDGKRVLLALSGGSDSSVTAYLLYEAQKRAMINVDMVYLRSLLDLEDNERHVCSYFGSLADGAWPGFTFTALEMTEQFLGQLRGKIGMHEKRLAVREAYREGLNGFIDRSTQAGRPIDHIVQGTLYTDICESGGGHDAGGARRARIKLHHNVNLKFLIPEIMPLADQVKDTARSLGRKIGMPEFLLNRHPTPGPGLSIRVSGEVTREKLCISRNAESILHHEIEKAQLYKEIWQAGTFLTREEHTCSKGDDATSGLVLVWWAVTSVNGFTAQAANLPHAFRQRVRQRFENEIKEVGAVCYRDSGKPVSTIEWG